jgi:hypothetical protein
MRPLTFPSMRSRQTGHVGSSTRSEGRVSIDVLEKGKVKGGVGEDLSLIEEMETT